MRYPTGQTNSGTRPQTVIPTSTYRLQLSRSFTFRDATRIVGYLSTLGISHCYVSPYLRARPGSTHGYDIIDHTSLNPEIGTPEDYEAFVAELQRHGMGQILDIVPNHMGVMGSDNAWWLDVLENGEASDYADYFDIDWDPIKDELQGKVLVPILGDQYGNVLDNGELKLVFNLERGEFSIFYFQHRFPVDPSEYPRVLLFQLERLQEKLGPTHEDFLELQSVATAFSHLPGRRGISLEQQAERNREKEVQKRRLAALCGRSAEIAEFLGANVVALNGRVGDAHSFDALHELIKTQAYRLAQWRVAADDINYRRFFDINDLAALRMENERVFHDTHRFILELVAQGKLEGLRIDHPDGLYDPAKYLCQLREESRNARLGVAGSSSDVYIVAEKILTGEERLRRNWPIQGTTGYEFCNLVNGLFIDRTAATKMERIYRAATGHSTDYPDLVYACKKHILKVALASELNVLANALGRIALSNRHTCDFTLNSLRSALAEIIACFPVYRTYVREGEIAPEDRRYVEQAVADGRRRSNAADLSVFDFIRRVLLLETNGGGQPEWYRKAITRFAMKFQQVSSAVMAKGLEDTAFYRYNRLVSLNEVGGNPNKFGTSVEEFHETNQRRVSCWPHSTLASSTHDSKRSEDVRARINVLSEMPALWRLRLRRWRDWNRSKKRLVDGKPAPSRNEEYLFYQTLVGTWPVESLDDTAWGCFVERIAQYMLKASREAKEHTSWANANADYETALLDFTHAALERRGRNRFIADFSDFQRQVTRLGMYNSLSQTLLKLTSPGVPDMYQGNELWEFTLVDPDNRQPVDYDRRGRLLDEIQRQSVSPSDLFDRLMQGLDDGVAKLYLTWKTLQLRKDQPELFGKGRYCPLTVTGERSAHVCAFARKQEGQVLVVAVPRLCVTLLGDSGESICDPSVWTDTRVEIPHSEIECFHNVFTGECLPMRGGRDGLSVGRLFRQFPVAALIGQQLPC